MKSQLRIGHFSPDAPNVSVFVDDELLLEDVSFGTFSDSMEMDAGSYEISVVPTAGGDAVIEATLDLDPDTFTTVLAIGELDAIRPLVLTDSTIEIGGDESMIRFAHLVPDGPAVDVLIDGNTTLFESVEFGDVVDFVAADSDQYELEIVASGTDDVVSSLTNSLRGGRIYTAMATGTMADGIDATVVRESIGKRKAVR